MLPLCLANSKSHKHFGVIPCTQHVVDAHLEYAVTGCDITHILWVERSIDCAVRGHQWVNSQPYIIGFYQLLFSAQNMSIFQWPSRMTVSISEFTCGQIRGGPRFFRKFFPQFFWFIFSFSLLTFLSCLHPLWSSHFMLHMSDTVHIVFINIVLVSAIKSLMNPL